MKTAISIDDRLMGEADRTAGELGLSRSGLVAIALKDFLERRRREEMLAKLDAVYAGAAEPGTANLLKGIKRKVRRTVTDRW